jgi:hypothetical protein
MADRVRWNEARDTGHWRGGRYEDRSDWDGPARVRGGGEELIGRGSTVYRGPASQSYGPRSEESFAGSHGVGENMFGPGGLREGGFGADSFGFGGRHSEDRSFRGESHRGRGPKGYRRSDERIREDLADCLTDDARLDASDIEVEVRDSEVELNGTVRSREDRRRAEDLAQDIAGVRHVQNNLRVERAGDAGYSAAAGAVRRR